MLIILQCINYTLLKIIFLEKNDVIKFYYKSKSVILLWIHFSFMRNQIKYS